MTEDWKPLDSAPSAEDCNMIHLRDADGQVFEDVYRSQRGFWFHSGGPLPTDFRPTEWAASPNTRLDEE